MVRHPHRRRVHGKCKIRYHTLRYATLVVALRQLDASTPVGTNQYQCRKGWANECQVSLDVPLPYCTKVSQLNLPLAVLLLR